MVYITLVDAAFLEWAWHLINYLSNMLKARVLAGENAAIEYDDTFHQRASHNELARWDLQNSDNWLKTVVSHARVWGEVDMKKLGYWREATKRMCWELNQARCHRTWCKYEHICKACLGYHVKVMCRGSTVLLVDLTFQQWEWKEEGRDWHHHHGSHNTNVSINLGQRRSWVWPGPRSCHVPCSPSWPDTLEE